MALFLLYIFLATTCSVAMETEDRWITMENTIATLKQGMEQQKYEFSQELQALKIELQEQASFRV